MTEVSFSKPPFHVTSWGESTSNNLSGLGLGRICRQITIHFEIHSAEEHSALNSAVQKAHFRWLLPLHHIQGKMQYVAYKGIVGECEIKQEGCANSRICEGTLRALVFESCSPEDDMNFPKPTETYRAGATYRHKKTGHLYTIEAVLSIKRDGKWHENGAVVYTNSEGGTYVRLLPDFTASFDFVSESR